MVAGYYYSFLVQARDTYSNNKAATLTSAVASAYSIEPYISYNYNIRFTGSISDAFDPGVYLVEMTVPKSQTSGTYNYNLSLGNSNVQTSTVSITPCVNTLAESLGYISQPWTTTDEGTIEYIVGETAI